MTKHQQQDNKKINRIAAAWNMIPNLLWTALFLLPVFLFCYWYINTVIIYVLLAVSLVPLFFPNSFFNKIQLSNNVSFYRRIGVMYLNAFAQSGSIVNHFLKKKYPAFKVVTVNRASIQKQYYQTYFFEKFHFSLFLFYLMLTVLAVTQHRIIWVFVLIICNLFYNVYPNLLQQYIRLKLKPAMRN